MSVAIHELRNGSLLFPCFRVYEVRLGGCNFNCNSNHGNTKENENTKLYTLRDCFAV
jgi:hypothetical protein